MKIKLHHLLLASAVVVGAVGFNAVDAQAQLRPTLGGGTPLTDDNLDGIDDSEQTEELQQNNEGPVFGDLPIPDDNSPNSDDINRNGAADRNANARARAAADTSSIRQLTNNNDPDVDGNPRATRATQVQINDPLTGDASPLGNRPFAPIEGVRNDPEVDPFAAIGLRYGSFTLFPTIQQEFGTTSNADSLSGGASSSFSQTTVRAVAQSNWSVHDLRAELGFDYQAFFNDESENLPTGNAQAELRIDVSREVTGRVGFDYTLTTEAPTSDNLGAGGGLQLGNRPIINDVELFSEIARTSGRLTTSLRASLDRMTFGDIEDSLGVSTSQEDRDNTLLLATARASYELSPALSPFFEVTAGGRIFDLDVDFDGNERDSKIFEVQTGATYNFSEKLNGSLGIGYRAEIFDDPALDTLQSPLLNASINWSPERLTTIAASLSTTLFQSSVADENGSVIYSGSVTATRDIRPNLSVNARFLASFTEADIGDREDTFLQYEVGGEWRLNRRLALTGRVSFEQAISSDDDSSFDEAAARIGLRIQK